MTTEQRAALVVKHAHRIMRAGWTNWWPTALEMARKEVDGRKKGEDDDRR